MIKIQDVKKAYGKTQALKGVNIQVKSGDFFGLLGPNGAGKSTLIHILSGYLNLDEGSVHFDDRLRKRGDNSLSHMIGFVPQNVALYEECNAWENLMIFGGMYGIPKKRLEARASEILERIQLTDRCKERVSRFSGGMKRRLNIGAALLHEPKILLCDEPTVGVDPHSRNAIFEFLEELNRQGVTVVYTTHYMEEVQRLCNRIGIIDHGKLIALGTLNELLDLLPYEEEIRLAEGAPEVAVKAASANFSSVESMEDGGTLIKLNAEEKLSDFFKTAETVGLSYRYIRLRQPTLEALFLHLTGRSLRD